MTGELKFRRDFDAEYAVIETVSPLIRRIVARNPGPFTYKGTGTYIVGHGEVAIIDPGPDLAEHIDAQLKALSGETVSHIVVTHTHHDHSPAAGPVQEATGAMTYAYGPHGSGQTGDSPTLEEGGDRDFIPDVEVRDGDVIEGGGWSLECVFTPGHTSNHMCYALPEENALFPGDHVMGWSTTVVSPPDGDMGAYMASLQRLTERDEAVYWPTHGHPVDNPRSYVRALIAHRRQRETQIAKCIERGLNHIPEMVSSMYQGLDERLIPAARRSVLAHIIHMVDTGRLVSVGEISPDGEYQLV